MIDHTFHQGERTKPLIVFIHGMGLTMRIWDRPEEVRVFSGTRPVTEVLGDSNLTSAFDDLHERGYPVLSWTQSRPAGPMQILIDELQELVEYYKSQAPEGIVLICHSRAGLAARKYLEQDNPLIRGLITIGTPHQGTTLGKWALRVMPIAERLNKAAQEEEPSTDLGRMIRFLCSEGMRELLPGSQFYAELRDQKQQGIYYASIGGTNPDLFKTTLRFLSRAQHVLPDRIVPEEMQEGRGDGLVSAKSAMLPYADDHQNFHYNHLSLLFGEEVREYMVNVVASM